MKRYSNIEFVFEWDFIRLYKLIEYIEIENEKQKLWDMWLTKLPYMTKDNYKSFDDYYKEVMIKPTKTPKEDILDMVYKIREKVNNEHI